MNIPVTYGKETSSTVNRNVQNTFMDYQKETPWRKRLVRLFRLTRTTYVQEMLPNAMAMYKTAGTTGSFPCG
jgi:arsenate reductase-like glutaredoxin family protein